MSTNDIVEIERIIGYSFKSKELLVRAFTHSSYVNEHKREESYERLEFLGDAALNYIVGLYLYDTFPSFAEGKLSKVRACTVDRETIAEVIDELGLLRFMRIGKGSGDIVNGSSVKVKCDLFEAILGATVIDNGEDISVAKEIVEKFLLEKITLHNSDYKSRLLEHCARSGQKAVFVVTKEGTVGPERFCISLLIDGKKVSEGVGENKKTAERAAAKSYLKLL